MPHRAAITNTNRQVQRTKGWIFDALMLLMDKKPYHKITVSDITGKAGIARQTFYRNYDDKDAVIFEYLSNTLKTDLLKIDAGGKNGQNNIVLTFNYNYMIAHRDNLKKILTATGIENRIFHESKKFPLLLMEQYQDSLSSEEYVICRYKLCYQITGCLRVLFDWFIHDMPLPADTLAAMLNVMDIPRSTQYHNIPNITIDIN
jgi:AcrR family transcriptional regulator